jgi:hypothetical protein
MTQLQRYTETFGGTDQRWIGSKEGFDTAETVTLDHDAWAGKVVNGRLKGGEPITPNKPDKVAAMLNRGRIIIKYLPSTVAAGATLAAGARFKLVDVDA